MLYYLLLEIVPVLVSDDTHSMDMTLRDIEERGFYTATFHYTAWTYNGDNATSGTSATLSTRPRPVSSKIMFSAHF